MSPSDTRAIPYPVPDPPDAPARATDEAVRGKSASTLARAGAIERAGLVPALAVRDTAAEDRTKDRAAAARTAPALRRNPLVALLHEPRDDAILATITAAMTGALAGTELALVLQPLAGDAAAISLREFLRRYRPAGIVLAPPLSEREDLAVICAVAQTPCIRLGPVKGEPDIACDERAAAADLVTWLVGQGHARIGLVAGPETSLSAQQRELGYLDAMADHGLDRGPALIVPGDHSFASGVEAGRLLLEISPRPTAIIAGNDAMAVGVLHAAAQMGVAVPAQLSVAGFDDTALATLALPPLTTMHLPWDRMAREAIRRIARGDATAPPDTAFTAELVVRDSVRPPPT